MSKFYSRWKKQLIKSKVISGLSKYPTYFSDWSKYSKMDFAEPIKLKDTYPCIFDRTTKTGVDSHYFYQHIWAFERILASSAELHIDIGSNVDFVGLLSAITKVQFVDIRPLDVSNVKNLESIDGSILDLPYEDNSVKSVSCLHVAEHIGLGRYGDPLDPEGTKKAAAELSRCLAKSGNLYFALPIGRERLCFNAHRIHDPETIINYFPQLKLVEFAVSGDDKVFVEDTDLKKYKDQRYACGMFWFTRE
jgi:predicted SAM-dependent methyltransferase